ncbi:CDK5RAP3-like protein [Dirofilaria immitis]
MVNEMEIPIDIHCNKLLDWLLSRRHCNKDWQKSVMIIREKISEAIQDMPEDERIVKLLQGSYINYFHCIRIVDILKDTEKGTKNFLGYYSSQRMNDWMEIQKMYEKKNIHLAEAAQILQRMIQYEIPALKKQISKSDQTITDCMKKENDYTKQIIDSRKQYEKELLKLGIEGVQLRQEILSLLADFPSFLDEITRSISSLNEPLNYYEQFQAYLHQNKKQNILLPLCRLLMKKGANVTVYEWKNNVKPARIELPSLDAWANEMTENNADDEIDFGDDMITKKELEQIQTSALKLASLHREYQQKARRAIHGIRTFINVDYENIREARNALEKFRQALDFAKFELKGAKTPETIQVNNALYADALKKFQKQLYDTEVMLKQLPGAREKYRIEIVKFFQLMRKYHQDCANATILSA